MKKELLAICSIVAVSSAECNDTWRVRMNDVEEIVRGITGQFEKIQNSIAVVQKKCTALEEKIKVLEKKLNEESPEVESWDDLLRKVDQSVKQKKYNDAINMTSIFIADHEKDEHITEAYMMLGDLYVQIKNYADALIAYKEVYTRDKKNADALSKMGICFVRQGNKANASKILGKLKISYKNETDAIEALQKALNIEQPKKAVTANKKPAKAKAVAE